MLAYGEDDLKRIDEATRVIAVDMPNDDSVSIGWRSYLTTVDEIERKTGFDFLSDVSKKIQKEIESRKDDQSTDRGNDEACAPADEISPETGDQNGDRQYFLGSRGGCYYLTASGTKKYVDRKFCASSAESNAPTANSRQETGNQNKSKDKSEQKNLSENKSSAVSRTYMKGARDGCTI